MGVARGGGVGLQVCEEQVGEGRAGWRGVGEWGEEVGETGVCVWGLLELLLLFYYLIYIHGEWDWGGGGVPMNTAHPR